MCSSDLVGEEFRLRLGEDELQSLITPVFKSPSRRHRETVTVSFAQVVRVRVTVAHEVVEPCDRSAVLIRERHRGRGRATGARTVSGHVQNGN